MPHQLTPEQQAVADERRAAREAKLVAEAIGEEIPANEYDGSGVKVLKRDWVKARNIRNGSMREDGTGKQTLRIITWNVSLMCNELVKPRPKNHIWRSSG